MFAWFHRWRERRQVIRQDDLHRQMLNRLLVEIHTAFDNNERFMAPLNFFRSEDEIHSFVVRLCKSLGGINVRANAAFGMLLFYRDDASDGLGLRIIGAKDEAAS